jgi:hypothetical protein
MINKPIYFNLEEIVCPHIYYKYGEIAWQFFDQKQLINIDWVRTKMGPMFVNNWYEDHRESDYILALKEMIESGKSIKLDLLPPEPHGLLDERGLRCNFCNLNLSKTQAGIIYVSPHFTGQGTDGGIQGRTPEEVRLWLVKNQVQVPHPFRLERNVAWLHIDSRDTGQKVTLVNP